MIAVRRPYNVVFPLVLIVGGLLILLANVGTLPADAGWRLLQLWPLILVMVGVQLLVPHLVPRAVVPAITLLVVGAIAAGAFAYAIAGPTLGAPSYTRFTSTSAAAGETSGTVTLDAAAARVTITTRDLGSQLYSAQVDYAGSAPKFSYEGGDIKISGGPNANVLNWGQPQEIVDLALSPTVAWSITINGAGTTATVDVSSGHLRSLSINGVGGAATVIATDAQGIVDVSLAGVGTALTLKLPPTAEYRVTTGGLGTGVNGRAQTDGWSTATDRYDINLDGLGSRVSVEQAGS